MRTLSHYLLPLPLLLACGDSSDDSAPTPDADLTADLATDYGVLVYAAYSDSVSAAEDLDAAIQALVDDPSDATLAAARAAWLDAREPYLTTEAFRFYDGPVDDIEGQINAWPLDENFIDYVDGNPDAGIINDPSVELTKANLLGENENGGEKNIATGFHAIEFLLWGQDMADDGPGDRPVSDYVDGESDNADRRRTYLKIISEQLVDDLTTIQGAWTPDEDNYRAELEASSAKEVMRRVLTGLTVLSGFETGGERLQAALDSSDQEDEHSCFSDNTHRDMIQDVVGIQSVYLGRYKRLDGSMIEGTSVYDVIAKTDAALADEIKAQIAQSLKLAKELETPFDQEILRSNTEGRARVEALIVSLQDQADMLEDVFGLYGLSVSIPE